MGVVRTRRLGAVTPLLAPRLWGTHLLALVAVAVFAGLGLWQVGAGNAERAAEARDLSRQDPVPLADVMGPDDAFPAAYVGQPVVLEGSWLPDATVYVSGREHEGVDGYWVATPLAMAGPEGSTDRGESPALYVVRGWTEQPGAAPAPPTGDAELVGWLQPAEGTGVMDEDRSDDVLPQLRTGDLVQHVDRDLYGGYAVVVPAGALPAGPWPVGAAATNPGTAGLAPASLEQLPEAARSTGLRNYLYGLQWFLFVAFAGYVWWQYVREATGRRGVRPVGEPAAEPDRVPSSR